MRALAEDHHLVAVAAGRYPGPEHPLGLARSVDRGGIDEVPTEVRPGIEHLERGVAARVAEPDRAQTDPREVASQRCEVAPRAGAGHPAARRAGNTSAATWRSTGRSSGAGITVLRSVNPSRRCRSMNSR